MLRVVIGACPAVALLVPAGAPAGSTRTTALLDAMNHARRQRGLRPPRVDAHLELAAWGTGIRGTATGIVRAWLRSPVRRADLLRPSFGRVGIGSVVATFRGTRNADVVTTDFAG